MVAAIYIPLWTLPIACLGLFWLLSWGWDWTGGVRDRVEDWWWDRKVKAHFHTDDDWD